MLWQRRWFVLHSVGRQDAALWRLSYFVSHEDTRRYARKGAIRMSVGLRPEPGLGGLGLAGGDAEGGGVSHVLALGPVQHTKIPQGCSVFAARTLKPHRPNPDHSIAAAKEHQRAGCYV